MEGRKDLEEEEEEKKEENEEESIKKFHLCPTTYNIVFCNQK